MSLNSVSYSMTRRKFLRDTHCGILGSTSITSALINMQLTSGLSAQNAEGDDYKAMVCVYLGGGNDSYNMLAPVEGDARTEYELARGEVGRPLSEFLPLVGQTHDGKTLGLHQSMQGVHDLYTAGNAAVVCNVGTLVEPTDLDAIQMGTVKLPLGLYSHSDQFAAWQSTIPEERNALSGWGGRLADLLRQLNESQETSMNISLAGSNLFQVGDAVSPFAINSNGVPLLKNWNQGAFQSRQAALKSLVSQEHNEVMRQLYTQSRRDAIETGESFQEAFLSAPSLVTEFDRADSFSDQLYGVAKSISARNALQKKRQVFFVNFGGWDHHASLEAHPGMLSRLSSAISKFYEAMVELGLSDQVTLFTASDFARTLSSNGGGTDHAWGGNQIVVGGAVNQGIYGTYPSLAKGSTLDVGRGRLLPTTSVDEYYSDIALWMGVSPSDMAAVLPNLNRFYDVKLNGAPLGFLNSGI